MPEAPPAPEPPTPPEAPTPPEHAEHAGHAGHPGAKVKVKFTEGDIADLVRRLHEFARGRGGVARAVEEGSLVVSARESGGVVWLPGSLPQTVSVAADARLERDELLVADDGFTAAPYPRSIDGVPKERNLSGVSFAVANVSGFLARLLEAHPDLRRVDDIVNDLQ